MGVDLGRWVTLGRLGWVGRWGLRERPPLSSLGAGRPGVKAEPFGRCAALTPSSWVLTEPDGDVCRQTYLWAAIDTCV
jgi:hypothetical protein